MDRRRAIAAGTLVLGIGLSAAQMFQDDGGPSVASPAMAAATTEPAAPAAPAKPAEPARAVSEPPLPRLAPPAPVADLAAPRTVPPEAATADAAPLESAQSCEAVLDLTPEPDAMIGVTLVAPCHPAERIVLSHEGLVITVRSTATGSVFTSLPALSALGEVRARLADGTELSASLIVPDAAEVARFVVQWQADDRLSLNAYADGAGFGDPGHRAPVALADLPLGTPVAGQVIRLGTVDVDLPMVADVFTFAGDATPLLTIEAEVTEQTCDRELLGETIEGRGGKSVAQELTLAMPDCAAVGEFLVLNITPADLTLASVE
ncbi:MAG: hypothetical protein RIR62_679 [Pseudomonadota bacterium]